MGYFNSKSTFFHLKHIQRVYLTLLSTTCARIHQIPYVIFETISHFSRHNSSVFFQQEIYILSTRVAHFHDTTHLHFSRHNSSVFFQQKIYILSTKKPIRVQIFRLSTAEVKVHRIPHAIFQTKSQFFFKLFCTFSAGTLYAIDKSSTSKYKFSDFHCSH